MALSVMALSISGAQIQPTDGLSGSRQSALGYVEDNSNATVTLISGLTGRSINLYRIIIMAATADTVTVRCGTTQKMAKLYLGANSGLDAAIFPFYVRCGAGEALTLVKGSASTAIGATFWYTQQP